MAGFSIDMKQIDSLPRPVQSAQSLQAAAMVFFASVYFPF